MRSSMMQRKLPADIVEFGVVAVDNNGKILPPFSIFRIIYRGSGGIFLVVSLKKKHVHTKAVFILDSASASG